MTPPPRPPLRHAAWLLEGESIDPQRLRALGGKAATLMGLAQAGYPVLPSLVLLPSAFELSRPDPVQLPQRLDVQVWQELKGALAVLEQLSQGALGESWEWSHGDGRWAVRSSGPWEDGERASYAGQFMTRLSVAGADLEEAILAVWRSAFGSGPAVYRRERGLPEPPETPAASEAPAVLIQPMLAPRCSGVAFSADPVSGRRGVTLVQATSGVAAALVAGAEEGDTWRLDREGRVLEHRAAPERTAAPWPGAGPRSLDAAAGGVNGDPAPPPPRAALGVAEAQRIAGLARRLGQHFGHPQDVEIGRAHV